MYNIGRGAGYSRLGFGIPGHLRILLAPRLHGAKTLENQLLSSLINQTKNYYKSFVSCLTESHGNYVNTDRCWFP